MLVVVHLALILLRDTEGVFGRIFDDQAAAQGLCISQYRAVQDIPNVSFNRTCTGAL